MKKSAILVLACMMFLSGCAYTQVEGPGLVHSFTSYQLTSADFTVLKRVSVEGEATLWFGLVFTGGKGYQALLQKAQAIGGDDIMNYSFDLKAKSILGPIYARGTWKATGIAIKLKSSVKGS